MAYKTREEILESVKVQFGETPSDAQLAIMEDITDSMPEENWKQKYEENDAAWRKRYTDRFTNGPEESNTPPNPETVGDPAVVKSFDDLFENIYV